MDNRIFTEADCEETGIGCSLKGKVVVLAPSDIQDKSQNQLYYCTGGSGAGVNAHGRTVFMVNLENGEFERWPRSCITGVLKPELLPDQENCSCPKSVPMEHCRWRVTNRSTVATVFWKWEIYLRRVVVQCGGSDGVCRDAETISAPDYALRPQ